MEEKNSNANAEDCRISFIPCGDALEKMFEGSYSEDDRDPREDRAE